jgi:hypothetical protein
MHYACHRSRDLGLSRDKTELATTEAVMAIIAAPNNRSD